MNQQRAARWAAVVILTGVVTLSGQSAVPARQDEVLPALLVEVKGLRAAMEQMATAGPRVQLFASRLQPTAGTVSTKATSAAVGISD